MHIYEYVFAHCFSSSPCPFLYLMRKLLLQPPFLVVEYSLVVLGHMWVEAVAILWALYRLLVLFTFIFDQSFIIDPVAYEPVCKCVVCNALFVLFM